MSSTPEQIAERLDAWADHEVSEGREDRSDGFEREASIHDQNAAMLNEAATTLRAQSEREKVLVGLLQRLEPSIGWRSAMGMSRDFMCEFCHQTHEHFARIEHTDKCPVPQVRAALAGAR